MGAQDFFKVNLSNRAVLVWLTPTNRAIHGGDDDVAVFSLNLDLVTTFAVSSSSGAKTTLLLKLGKEQLRPIAVRAGPRQ